MAKPAKTNATAANDRSLAYLGQHLRGTDRGRVILPVEWRPEGSPTDFKVIIWPVTTRECLLVLPPARWEAMQRNLESLSLADEQAAMVERLISSMTSVGSLDRYGRLGVPEDVAKSVKIDDEALLVGRLNKFEIWNPTRFAEALARPAEQLITEALKSIKI